MNGLYSPTREQGESQANQFILFVLSTYNTKSIFYKESTAHAIPPVQLWKSNAITGLLPMSTFCTWTPRQNRHCLLTLTIVQLWEWQRRHLIEQTAPGQTNHLTKKCCSTVHSCRKCTVVVSLYRPVHNKILNWKI